MSVSIPKKLTAIPLATRSVSHRQKAPVLNINGLTVHYDGRLALKDLSFKLNRGEQVAVVGPNGSGKSTLLKAIAGLIQPSRGSIKIGGYEPGGHTCIAYVPQRSQVDWTFPVRVIDVVMMGRVGKLGWLHSPQTIDWERAHQCLKVVDLDRLAQRQIGQLSGGQQQKMFMARALAQEAELMLLDEPLTGLDVTSEKDIFQILAELRRTQVTIMVATHELDTAAKHFDRVILLNCHLFGIGTPKEVFTPEKLARAYGSYVAKPNG